MSKYLEKLVENMLADNVSEEDIKLVIKEINQKSPLRQTITSPNIDIPPPSVNIGGQALEESDDMYAFAPAGSEQLVTEEEKEQEEFVTTEDPIEIETVEEEVEEEQEDISDKQKEVEEELDKQIEKEEEFVHPFYNDDLTIKPEFFELDEDKGRSSLQNFYGGLGLSIDTEGFGTNKISLSFPDYEPVLEIPMNVWLEKNREEYTNQINEYINSYIDDEFGRENFNVYSEAVYKMTKDVNDINKQAVTALGKKYWPEGVKESELLLSSQDLNWLNYLNEFKQTDAFKKIQEDSTPTDEDINELIKREIKALSIEERQEIEKDYTILEKKLELAIDDLFLTNIMYNEDYEAHMSLIEGAISSVYTNRIKKAVKTETGDEYYPIGFRGPDNDLLQGMYDAGRFVIPMGLKSAKMWRNAQELKLVENIISRYNLRNRNPNEKIEFEGYQKYLKETEFKWWFGPVSDKRRRKWGYKWYCLEPGKKDIKANYKYVADVNKRPKESVCRLLPNTRQLNQALDIQPTKKFPKKFTKEWREITGIEHGDYKTLKSSYSQYNKAQAKNKLEKAYDSGPTEYTVGELLKKLEEVGDIWQDRIFESFLEVQEVKEILQKLGQPQFVTDANGETKWSYDIDDNQKVLGTQIVQMFVNIMTFGMTNFNQSAGGFFYDALMDISAKEIGLSIDAFNKLPVSYQTQVMFDVIESGLMDKAIADAHAVGAGSWFLEYLGDLFVIGRFGGTILPRGFWQGVKKEGLKRTLQQTSSQKALKNFTKEGFSTVFVEKIVEVGQEGISDYYKLKNNVSIGTPGEIRARYLNVAFTTLLTVPFIFIGGRLGNQTVSQAYDAVQRRILSYKNPEHVRIICEAEIDGVKSAYQNGDLDFDDMTKQIEALEAAKSGLSSLDDTVLKSLNAKEKQAIINEELVKIKNTKEITKLEKELEDLEKGSREYKNLYARIYRRKSKVKNAQQKQVNIRRINQLLTEGKDKCNQINNNTKRKGHKDFGKKAVYLKSKDDVRRHFEENGYGSFTKEEIDNYLNEKENNSGSKSLALTSKDNMMFVVCTDIVQNMIEAEGDWAASNSVVHEIVHIDTADLTAEQLLLKIITIDKTIQEASKTDPIWKSIAEDQKLRETAYLLKELSEGKSFEEARIVILEEYLPTLSDVVNNYRLNDWSVEGSVYWMEIQDIINDFVSEGVSTPESALEFIKRFNLNNYRTGVKTTNSWWLDENNNPIIKTFWENELQTSGLLTQDQLNNQSRNYFTKNSQSTVYGEALEFLIKQHNQKYTSKSDPVKINLEIQQEFIKTQQYIFPNKDERYSEERALEIQKAVRTDGANRWKGEFVTNNIKSVIKLINSKVAPDGTQYRKDFEELVIQAYYDIVRTYNPLITEAEWNELSTEQTKVVNKEIEDDRNITNPVPFGAYMNANLPLRIADIFEELNTKKVITQAKQIEDATGLDSDYDIESVLSMEQAIEDNVIPSEVKEIFNIENTDPFYKLVNETIYTIMGENIEYINNESFSQDMRNKFRELFFKQLKKITGTPKKGFRDWLETENEQGITNAERLYNVIPTSVFSTSYNEFVDLVINLEFTSEKGRMKANTAKKSKDVENIYAGNKMWVKKAYTDEIAALWLETINPTKPVLNRKGEMKVPDANSTQDVLFKHVSDIISKDAVMQAIQSEKFKNEFGIDASQIMTVSQKLQRGQGVKFSLSTRASKTIKDLGYKIPPKLMKGRYAEIIEDPKEFLVEGMDLVRMIKAENLNKLEDVIKLVMSKRDIPIETRLFVISLWDRGAIKNAEAIFFKTETKRFLQEEGILDVLDNINKLGTNNGRKINDTMKKEVFNALKVLAPKFSKKWWDKIGLDIVGVHYSGLDNAKNKKQTILVKNPDTGKEESKRVNILDEKGNEVRGEYYESVIEVMNSVVAADAKLPTEVEQALKDSKKILGGETPSPIVKSIDKIIKDGLKDGLKLDDINALIQEKHGAEISAANNANKIILNYFFKVLTDAYINNEISDGAFFTLLQMQTSINKGVRAYSSLELYSIIDDGSRIYNEHLQTMSLLATQIYKETVKYKKNQHGNLTAKIKEILDRHSTWLGSYKQTKKVDDIGKKTNTAGINRILLLGPKDLNTIYNPEALKGR